MMKRFRQVVAILWHKAGGGNKEREGRNDDEQGAQEKGGEGGQGSWGWLKIETERKITSERREKKESAVKSGERSRLFFPPAHLKNETLLGRKASMGN